MFPTPTDPSDTDRLSGKVALVTGLTHGIGLAIATRFAREGASLVINDEGAYDGARVAAALREAGTDVCYVEADVRDPAAIEELVDRVVDEHGRIDVVVNNVGDGRVGEFSETTIDDWNYVMETTLRSSWLTVRHAMEHIPPGGSVINVSSTNARATVPLPYDVAKAGIDALTRSLAIELGPLDIRANAIAPGRIVVEDSDPTDEDLRQDRVIDPAGRWGVPADVAGPAVFFASDESAFVTGVSVPVDGGRSAVLLDDQHANWRRDRD